MARLDRWFPLLLFLLALLVRFAAAGLTQFDGLYGQDPYAYYTYATELRQALVAGQAPPPFFWPLGYPLLITVFTAFIGVQPLAGQLVSMITGALIAPLVYLLVRLIRPESYVGGLVAGLLAGVAAQLLLSSVSVMADAAALFWATLSAWAMLRYGRDLRLSWLVAAAATLAFAVLTRWVYGLLVVPWGLSAWLACREARLSWRQIALAGGVATLVGLLILGAHFAADLGRERISYAGDIEVYSWNPLNAFKQTVNNPDGTFHYERPIGLFYALPAIHPAYVFPLFSPFLLLGLWWLWHSRQTTVPLSRLILLVGWPLIVYLFLAGVTWQNWRFPLTLFPPLLVLVGLGLEWLWSQKLGRWRPLLLAGLGVALVGSLAWSVRDIGRFTAWKETQLATAQAVDAQLPPGATLLVFEITLTMRQYTDLEAIELFAQEETDVAALVAATEPLYLLLNVTNVESQWLGKTPHQHYVWLQENSDLQVIGQYEPYTLFQITRP